MLDGVQARRLALPVDHPIKHHPNFRRRSNRRVNSCVNDRNDPPLARRTKAVFQRRLCRLRCVAFSSICPREGVSKFPFRDAFDLIEHRSTAADLFIRALEDNEPPCETVNLLVLDDLPSPVALPIECPDATNEANNFGVRSFENEIGVLHRHATNDQPFCLADGGRGFQLNPFPALLLSPQNDEVARLGVRPII